MAEQIKDGAGTGNRVKINGNNRMYTNSVSISEDYQATKIGNSYNINTGVITLTDAVETPLMYVKNNGDEDLHITAIAVGLSPSTNGTGGIPKITIIRNPVTIDFSTAVDISSNRNFGSSKSLTVDAYKGATGDTMTDGTDHIIFYQTTNGRLFATIDEIVPKGSSIGIKIAPQTSNDDMTCYAALICHTEDPNE